MSAIELMIGEHKYIKRVLTVIRKLCIKIVNGSEVDYDAFFKAIDFVRNYADKHHHSKEEDILFKIMDEELDPEINREAIRGMFVEHDYGRFFISNLEEALKKAKTGDTDSRVDIIANAIAYTDLLHRHIHKEDNALFIFAQKNLSATILEDIDERCGIIEHNASQKGIQEKYTSTVEELEKRVG